MNEKLTMSEKFAKQDYAYYDALNSLYGHSTKYKGLLRLYDIDDQTREEYAVLDGIIDEYKFFDTTTEIKLITFYDPLKIHAFLKLARTDITFKAIISLCSHNLPCQEEYNVRLGNISCSTNELGGYTLTIQMKIFKKYGESAKEELLNLLAEHTIKERGIGNYSLNYNEHTLPLRCEPRALDSRELNSPENIRNYYRPSDIERIKIFDEETIHIDWTKPIYKLTWYTGRDLERFVIIENNLENVLIRVKRILGRM